MQFSPHVVLMMIESLAFIRIKFCVVKVLCKCHNGKL